MEEKPILITDKSLSETNSPSTPQEKALVVQQVLQNNNTNGEIMASSSTSTIYQAKTSLNSKQDQPCWSTYNKDKFHLIIDETLKNNITSEILQDASTNKQDHKKKGNYYVFNFRNSTRNKF